MKIRFSNLLGSVLFCVGIMPAAPAIAQSPVTTFQPSGSGAAAFEVYRFDSPEAADLESLSLVSIPLAARLHISSQVGLAIRGGSARAVLRDAQGKESTLSGLIDTELVADVTLKRSNLAATVSGIVVLPTGNTRHSAEEARVAGVLASEFLPFRTTSLGGGGAAGAALNVSRTAGVGTIGAGVAYLFSRDFQPFEESAGAESFLYRPGDQLHLRLAVDRNVGGSGKLSLSLAFQQHEDDALDGANLFRAGNRIQGLSSLSFAAGPRSSAMLYVGGLHSQEGVALQSVTQDNSARTLLLLGGGLRFRVGAGVLLAGIDARVFRRASGFGQCYLGALGATYEAPAGALTIAPSVRLRVGNYVISDAVETAITGADFAVSVRSGPRGR